MREVIIINRKQSILEAAKQSFALFGYKGTTMDHVATAAKVGKGTIYTFFKNKEELLHAVIEEVVQEMSQLLQKTVDPNRSFFDNLHHTLIQILDYRRNHPLLQRLFLEARELRGATIQLAVELIEQHNLQFIQSHIERAIEKGELKPCPPEITAFVMIKLYVALSFEWEKKHPPLAKEELAELFRLYLAEGLAPSAPPGQAT